jgi:hypothetical protein
LPPPVSDTNASEVNETELFATPAVIEFIISFFFQSLNVQSVNNQKKTAHGKITPSFKKINKITV